MPMGKTCVLCGEDCSSKARVIDRQGNYYCKTCHAAAEARKRNRGATPTHTSVATDAKPDVGDADPFNMREALMEQQAEAGDMMALEAPAASTPVEEAASQGATNGVSGAMTPDGPSTTCPSCDTRLPAGTKVCVSCGINVDTGRAIVMSRGVDENLVHYNAERVLRPLSWLLPFSFSPVASEAFGNRKPYVTWAVLAISCVVSFWFLFSSDTQMRDRKNLMLWGGDETPTADYILEYYELANWGDRQALNRQMRELDDSQGQAASRMNKDILVQAHASLSLSDRALGEFRSWQLLTHALLHGDLLHLAGNMVFLIIFGSRVNALIGNIATLVLYPLLAVAAAWAELMSMSSLMPVPMLGASGAIMGLAGIYFVFFPVNRMHMSIWFRFFFFFRMKVWALRGFWVVLFYIAWDVMYVSLGSDTGIAHWAHLGGFIAGVVLGLALLLSRVFYAGGTDLLSVLLGKHVWPLTGRPSDHEKIGFSMPKM